ncbi:hypothetical protein GCM10010266_52140 [Streptomyces griseomycini]|nr:hypothetical protein GCM10010266_52140 [Streptomyces griseomycini]
MTGAGEAPGHAVSDAGEAPGGAGTGAGGARAVRPRVLSRGHDRIRACDVAGSLAMTPVGRALAGSAASVPERSGYCWSPG